MVSSAGYNPARMAKGWNLEDLDIRMVLTNFALLEFGGPNHQLQLRSLHPGVSVEQVQEATGFELHVPANIAVTPDPTEEQLAILVKLDPHNLRATAMG